MDEGGAGLLTFMTGVVVGAFFTIVIIMLLH